MCNLSIDELQIEEAMRNLLGQLRGQVAVLSAYLGLLLSVHRSFDLLSLLG